MKKKDLGELRNKELKDLKKLSLEKAKEVGKVDLEIKTQKEKNLKKARNLRKELAQLLTIVREKEILEKEVKKN